MSAYIREERGQGTLWPSSQLKTPSPSHARNILPKTISTNCKNITLALEYVTPYRYLQSLEFAYILGKILQVITQSLLSKLDHGDYSGQLNPITYVYSFSGLINIQMFNKLCSVATWLSTKAFESGKSEPTSRDS